MSVLRRAVGGGSEARSTLASPSSWMYDAFGAPVSASGRSVGPEQAQRYSAAFACMRAIADAGVLCPLISYRRSPDGLSRERERVLPNTVAQLMSTPTPWQPFSQWVWTHLYDLNGWGDAFYAKLRTSATGPVAALMRIHPRRVQTYIEGGEKRFKLTGSVYDKLAGEYGQEDILHIYGMSADGVTGMSPITMAREAFALGITLEEYVSGYVQNGVTAGYVLTTEQRVTEQAAKRIARSWRSRAHGRENTGEVVVLEQGLKPAQLGLPLKDAQFLEQRKYSATEMARVFGVPPWRIAADGGSTMTYSNVEQEGLNFVTYTMGFWFTITQDHLAMDVDLYPRDKSRYPEFLMDALLRADTATRMSAYSTATGGKPWMWPTEVRSRENLPVGDKEKALDEAAQPGAAAPAAAAPPPEAGQQPPAPPAPQEDQ